MSMFEFDYENGQQVVVIPLDLPGVVLQRCDRGSGQQDFQVVYWADGKRNVEWLMSHELRSIA